MFNTAMILKTSAKNHSVEAFKSYQIFNYKLSTTFETNNLGTKSFMRQHSYCPYESFIFFNITRKSQAQTKGEKEASTKDNTIVL